MSTRDITNALFIAPADDLQSQFAGPPSDPAIFSLAVTQLRSDLIDAGQVRSFDTRRVCVDALKGMQSLPAYNALIDAQAAVDASKQGATGSQLALINDLSERIHSALSPYFKK